MPSKDLQSGELTEGHFRGVTAALAQLGGGKIVVGEIQGSDGFERTLASACRQEATTFAACDLEAERVRKEGCLILRSLVACTEPKPEVVVPI